MEGKLPTTRSKVLLVLGIALLLIFISFAIFVSVFFPSQFGGTLSFTETARQQVRVANISPGAPAVSQKFLLHNQEKIDLTEGRFEDSIPTQQIALGVDNDLKNIFTLTTGAIQYNATEQLYVRVVAVCGTASSLFEYLTEFGSRNINGNIVRGDFDNSENKMGCFLGVIKAT